MESATQFLRPLAVVGLSEEQEHNQNYPGFVQFTQPFPVQTIIIASVYPGERMTGVIVIDYGSDRLTYRKDEFALMEVVARLCALVIDRQQLMDEGAEAQGRVIALREANTRMEEFLGIASEQRKAVPERIIDMSLPDVD